MKRFLAFLLTLALLLGGVPALAAEGEARAVIGADLNDVQIGLVYENFGLSRGDVRELTVTNAEERDYLEGLVDESVIGTMSLSCVYIRRQPEGSGLSVRCSNISWCTEEMYQAAMLTAGITDAEVIVTAPFAVSGTAALTGIYKAYEDMLGQSLAQDEKETAAEELIITAELAEITDDEAALSIIHELKLILDQTKSMTDEELEAQIRQIAGDYGYTLTDELVARIVELCRSLEGLSVEDLQSRIEGFRSTIQSISETVENVSGFGQKLAEFFRKAVAFIQNLLGKQE